MINTKQLLTILSLALPALEERHEHMEMAPVAASPRVLCHTRIPQQLFLFIDRLRSHFKGIDT